MKKYFKLLRVTHWAKNGLILLPIIFSGNLFNVKLLGISLLGLLMFSALSSVIYINNDIEDIENKKNILHKLTPPQIFFGTHLSPHCHPHHNSYILPLRR